MRAELAQAMAGAAAALYQLSDGAAFRAVGDRAGLSQLARPGEPPASLYLHVPFCRSMCWYCGCHTTLTQRDDPVTLYAAALRSEAQMVAEAIGKPREISHIAFGGGTPTMMSPDAFVDLMGALRFAFRVLPAAEIAIEIDPRTLTAPMIDASAIAASTVRALACRVSIHGPARHQPRPEFRSDGECGRAAAPRRDRQDQFRFVVRASAAEHRLMHRQSRNASRCAPIASRCSATRTCRP